MAQDAAEKLSNEVGELPDFPSERRSRLVVHEFDSSRPPPHAWQSARRATLRDILDNVREAPICDRETLARAICPELAERLRIAEEVIEGTMDAALGVNRAKAYVERYGNGDFRAGENELREPEARNEPGPCGRILTDSPNHDR